MRKRPAGLVGLALLAAGCVTIGFGVVHAPNNGCAPSGGTNVLANSIYVQNWWDQSGSPSSLSATSQAEGNCNQVEIPLIFTAPDWNDTSANITNAMTAYFQQNPKLPVWQFGWEENVHTPHHCCDASQLATIDQELAAVAAARTNAGVNTQLAYQMVLQTNNPAGSTSVSFTGSTVTDFDAFFSSAAPEHLDVIAAHPYMWNNFPVPDSWEPGFLVRLNGDIQNSNNPNVKVIFTEGGAPVCDTPSGCQCANPPSDCLTAGGVSVRGMTQEEQAEYLVKFNIIAFNFNPAVQKVLWYQQGFGADPVCGAGSSAESCFGFTNSNGPRLSQSAYTTMTACENGKSLPSHTTQSGGVQVYDGADNNNHHCVVAWTYLSGTTEVVRPTNPQVATTLNALTNGRPPTRVQTTTGADISFTDGTTPITVTPAPIFISTN